MTQPLRLGAPGLYELPDEPIRALTGERMDACAFLGVAPRGPAQVPYFRADWAPTPCDSQRSMKRSVPVLVESWSEYLRLYGGEGPGLLRHAVASFFENGGQRAYIVRIVHDYGPGDPRPTAGVARAELGGIALAGGGPVTLRARNEGSWGNALLAELTFKTQPLTFDASLARLTDLTLPRDTNVPAGALLRLTLENGLRVMRFIAFRREEWHPEDGVIVFRATFDSPLTAKPSAAEIVEGELSVDDGDGRTEVLERLGFSSSHPRWLGRVLINESALLYPDDHPAALWVDGDMAVPASLGVFKAILFAGGEDRYEDIVPSDFFGDWVPGDECPGEGVTCLTETNDVSLLCAPDLYSPAPIGEVENILPTSLAGPDFAACVELPTPRAQGKPPPDLDGLRLDPAADLNAIIELQQRLVDFADQLQSLIVLLDVPPKLNQRKILFWRSRFASAYAAAYHPWVEVALTDGRKFTLQPRLSTKRPARQPDGLIRVNPSAVAAGIIAQSEMSFGVPYGPANLIAQGVVDLADHVSPLRHDELHPIGINVYLRERDGARLTAARTLSLDPAYRQLSIRRLVTMLRRVLERQMQWMVFEPNNDALRADVRHVLTAYLRQLYLANAFRGATESEAFFVRCDETLNPPSAVDAGQLVAQVGVAPAEPLEFIVLQIARQGDGTLRIGE